MARTQEIRLTKVDYERLWRVVETKRDHETVDELENELERAVLVRPEEVPPDVVTMNSRVELEDLETSESQVISVVYPSDSSPRKGRISVLAPMGTALLGCRAEETVEWQMPGGLRKLRIKRILYQPEAQGRYDL